MLRHPFALCSCLDAVVLQTSVLPHHHSEPYMRRPIPRHCSPSATSAANHSLRRPRVVSFPSPTRTLIPRPSHGAGLRCPAALGCCVGLRLSLTSLHALCRIFAVITQIQSLNRLECDSILRSDRGAGTRNRQSLLSSHHTSLLCSCEGSRCACHIRNQMQKETLRDVKPQCTPTR